MTPDRRVTTVVGTVGTSYARESIGSPNGICVDDEDCVYFTSFDHRVVYRYNPIEKSVKIIAGHRDVYRRRVGDYANPLNIWFK